MQCQLKSSFRHNINQGGRWQFVVWALLRNTKPTCCKRLHLVPRSGFWWNLHYDISHQISRVQNLGLPLSAVIIKLAFHWTESSVSCIPFLCILTKPLQAHQGNPFSELWKYVRWSGRNTSFSHWSAIHLCLDLWAHSTHKLLFILIPWKTLGEASVSFDLKMSPRMR